MDILIGILTSKDQQKLKRCIESVLSQTTNVVVICNTLDSSYVAEAQKAAEEYALKFLVTESNGTPAKGKNSVLDYFSTTHHQYYMQVDGDDCLSPNCLDQLSLIVDANPSVDVVGLTNNFLVYDGKQTTLEEFFNSKDVYSFADAKGSSGISIIRLGKFLANNLIQNRMLLYSRKIVETFRFDERFLGSEDIVGSYKLFYDKSVNYILTDADLYVYDLNKEGNLHSFLSNPSEIKKVMRELEFIVGESTP